jgi:hypothetical protein
MYEHINISSTTAVSHRRAWVTGHPNRTDGTTDVPVLYRFNGRQTSTPFDDRRPDVVAIICNSGSQLCPSRES